MASSPTTENLRSWFLEHGGHLHPSISILSSSSAGIHLHASQPLPPNTPFASCPHSLTLSYLNALVDDAYPVFRDQRHRFKVEAIGYWYLALQFLNRRKSFWRPYLESLPAPEEEGTQGVWFEDPEDWAWLEGTDVGFTVKGRMEVYWGYYTEGRKVLEQAGMDVEDLTWQLFKWAIAMFTSRSFASRALHPESSKYWTAYKTNSATGSRQTVLLDMSRTSPEDLEFPVLFPGLDAANHHPASKIEWTFDPGRFTIALSPDGAGVEAGEEVFNNYGPKGNGELLIGYGFCFPQNAHDTVAMTLKAPPPALQDKLRAVHPGYFDQNGSWDGEKSTFHLFHPPPIDNPKELFQHLPEPLLELLLYILSAERNHPFTFISEPREFLNAQGQRYLPYISRMLVQSLANKLANLQASTPGSEPRNERQKQASIHRNGQVEILTSLVTALKGYVRSLIPADQEIATVETSAGPVLLSLGAFFALLKQHGVIDERAFLDGLEAVTGASSLQILSEMGWGEVVWIWLLCYTILSSGVQREGTQWLKDALRDYLPLLEPDSMEIDGDDVDDGEVSTAREILAGARKAGWNEGGWTLPFVLGVQKRFGVGVGAGDMFQVGGEQGVVIYLCLHFDDKEGIPG